LNKIVIYCFLTFLACLLILILFYLFNINYIYTYIFIPLSNFKVKIHPASKDRKYNVMYNSNAILSYGWMHLTTSITHSSRIINPVTCGFLFAVNINQVTALGRKRRLKEGRGPARVDYLSIVCAREPLRFVQFKIVVSRSMFSQMERNFLACLVRDFFSLM